MTAPALLSKSEPEYSEAARAAKFQGTVLLYVEIEPDGTARNIQVRRSLGLGLDEKAIGGGRAVAIPARDQERHRSAGRRHHRSEFPIEVKAGGLLSGRDAEIVKVHDRIRDSA